MSSVASSVNCGRTTELLWHYTSFDAFLSIIQNKALWATDGRYVNDAYELKYGFDHLFNWLDRRTFPSKHEYFHQTLATDVSSLRTFGRVYISCFSQDGGDRMSQWGRYCPSSGGVAIGFSADALQQTAANNGFSLVECEYFSPSEITSNQGKLDDLTARCLEHVLSDREEYGVGSNIGPPYGPQSASVWTDLAKTLRREVASMVGRIKDAGFSEEREIRLISALRDASHPSDGIFKNSVNVMATKGIIRPIVKLDLRLSTLETDNFDARDRVDVGIREVFISPHDRRELMVDAVIEALNEHKIAMRNTPQDSLCLPTAKYGGDSAGNVFASTIPYRHW